MNINKLVLTVLVIIMALAIAGIIGMIYVHNEIKDIKIEQNIN